MGKTQRNQRKKDSHQSRYGMTAHEWSEFKKSNPKEAHEVREKALVKLNRGEVSKPYVKKKSKYGRE